MKKNIPTAFLPKIFLTALSFLIAFSLAAQINVTNPTDAPAVDPAVSETSTAGGVTVRSAIQRADFLGGAQTINIPAGTYNLTLGTISFGNNAQNITLAGASSTTTIISMSAVPAERDRIFLINPPGTNPNVHTTIQDLTFQNGYLKSDLFGGGAILAGGPSNSLTITRSIFNNNTIDATTGGTTGGAINMSGGGFLTINQSLFTNNSNPTGDGGAVNYFLQNFAGLNGSISITRSLFTNNTVSVGGGNGGGAIGIQTQGSLGGATFSTTINNNTFRLNSATGVGAVGGAIKISHGFAPGNTIQIHYNRIVENTSTVFPDGLAMNSAAGDIDASNNWWGCNTGPSAAPCDGAAMVGSGGVGTLTTNPYLEVRSSSVPNSMCPGGTSTVTSSFLLNSADQPVLPVNLTEVIGLPITYYPTLGTVNPVTTTIQSTGTSSTTFTSNGTAGTASVTGVVDQVPVNDPEATASIFVITPAFITTSPSSVTTCAGNTATFTVVAGGTSITYQWYKDNILITDGPTGTGMRTGTNSPTLQITNTSPVDNGGYHVVVQNQCATVQSSTATLTVNPNPTATISGSDVVCSGNSGRLLFTATGGGTITISYVNSGGQSGTVTGTAGTFTGTVVTPATPGTYTYTITGVTDANGCTNTGTGVGTVTVNALPTGTISGNQTICAGGSATITFTVTGAGTITVSYKDQNGTPYTASGTAPTITHLITQPVAGTYTYTINNITDANGCTNSGTGSASVVAQSCVSGTIAGNSTICAGGTATLTFSVTGSGTVTVTYGDTQGGVYTTSGTQAGSPFTATVGPLSAGTHTFTIISVQDSNGNTSGGTGTATVNVTPSPSATMSGTSTVCAGSTTTTLTFTATGSGTISITYANSGGQSGTVTGTAGTFTRTVVVPVTPGTYTYTITGVRDASGCTGTGTSTAIVNASPCTDLSITKSVNGEPLYPSRFETYSIKVRNLGGATANNVEMNDVIPAGTVFVSLTAPAGWTVTTPPVGGTGTVSATKPTLTVAEGEQSFILTVKTTPTVAPGTVISNTATVSSTTTDSNMSNNSSTATKTVTASPPCNCE